MVSSMPGSELEKSPPRLSRGWWIGLLSGLALLAVWSLFNILVDPTGEFGQSGRFAFNRAPPPAVIAAGTDGNNPAFFTRAIRESRSDVFLIGASRTRRGFDTCGRPEVLRIAGSAWGLRELARLQETILETRGQPVTLLIEVGRPTAERPAITDPVQAAASVALSPRTTIQSLQTVIHSLGSGETPLADYAPCAALDSAPSDWTEAERSARYALGLIDMSRTSLAQGRRSLLVMADQADQVCRRRRIKHRLVFFTLPSSPKPSPFSTYDRVFQDNADRVVADFAGRTPAPGGCEITYVNFAAVPPGTPAQQAQWGDRQHWSDYAHFSPMLGAVALEALLRPVPTH